MASYSYHGERPKLRTWPVKGHRNEPRMSKAGAKGDAVFHRPHMEETRMAELIVEFWRAKGFTAIEAHADPNGIIRSNIGSNVYPPKG